MNVITYLSRTNGSKLSSRNFIDQKFVIVDTLKFVIFFYLNYINKKKKAKGKFIQKLSKNG